MDAIKIVRTLIKDWERDDAIYTKQKIDNRDMFSQGFDRGWIRGLEHALRELEMTTKEAK